LAAGKMEGMDPFVSRAGAEEPRAIPGESEAVERFVDLRPGCDCFFGEIQDDNFVLTVAAVEHGGIPALGMQSEIDGKVSDGNLGASGSKYPLVGEQDRTIGPFPGQFGCEQRACEQRRADSDQWDGAEHELVYRGRKSGGKALKRENLAYFDTAI